MFVTCQIVVLVKFLEYFLLAEKENESPAFNVLPEREPFTLKTFHALNAYTQLRFFYLDSKNKVFWDQNL